MKPHEQLLRHVQRLERLTGAKQAAAAALKEAFDEAKGEGFDPATLKVVLKLRQLTPNQRRERRALEAIYLASLGMLDGDSLPDAARRRLDDQPDEPSLSSAAPDADSDDTAASEPSSPEEQPALELKTPEEARQEGSDAAAAGKRIYDNPYRAGDPCRAAWDEGWCAQHQSHGMDTPPAYQRRTEKPTEKPSGDEAGEMAGGAA